jgi:hypothetical protein
MRSALATVWYTGGRKNLRAESAEKRRLKKALQGKARISLSF